MTREELYRSFGPILLEAIVLIIQNEINILRTKAGLSERTTQQIMDAVEAKLSQLDKYEWMAGD